jgi:hypothetical protein
MHDSISYPDEFPMSSALFELLCVQAEAGRSIDLAVAGISATFTQAKTLVTLLKDRGILSLRNHGYDDCEMVELRLLGCRWVKVDANDRPQTPPPDKQLIW